MNLTIGTHFCRGEAVLSEMMIGKTHLDCGMSGMDKECDETGKQSASLSNPPCCDNQYQTFQASNDFINDVVPDETKVYFAAIVAYIFTNQFLFSKSAEQFYSDYYPPPLQKDIQVLFQTFLI